MHQNTQTERQPQHHTKQLLNPLNPASGIHRALAFYLPLSRVATQTHPFLSLSLSQNHVAKIKACASRSIYKLDNLKNCSLDRPVNHSFFLPPKMGAERNYGSLAWRGKGAKGLGEGGGRTAKSGDFANSVRIHLDDKPIGGSQHVVGRHQAVTLSANAGCNSFLKKQNKEHGNIT